MAKGTTVFIATIVYMVALAVGATSSWGMGLNSDKPNSSGYKAGLAFVYISSLTLFTAMILISYHATKLYCR